VKPFSKNFILEMSGVICLVFALTICAATLLKVPVGSEFFTLAGNILVAYVVQGMSKILGTEPEKPKDPPPSTS
jgi:hypothetical protein